MFLKKRLIFCFYLLIKNLFNAVFKMAINMIDNEHDGLAEGFVHLFVFVTKISSYSWNILSNVQDRLKYF